MTSAITPAMTTTTSDARQREQSAAVRESIVLPTLLLTVALGGGFRMAANG